jgi:hypothetical protein
MALLGAQRAPPLHIIKFEDNHDICILLPPVRHLFFLTKKYIYFLDTLKS